VRKLDVVFLGWGQRWVLGTLAHTGPHILFEYSSEALRRGVKLSELSMPLAARTYSKLPAFFDGLPGFIADALPDGWGLLLMDRVFRKAGRDPATLTPLERLAFIGARAMGALAFEPPIDLELEPDDLTLRQLAEAARDVTLRQAQGERLMDTRALETLALVGGSPHGARPKALVNFDASSRTISTAANAAGTPWLVKFPAQGEHAEVCGIEFAYAQAARLAGIDVPAVHHFTIGPKLAAFGIERFDRHNGMRVPIQSFAAALHADFRIPSLDYQAVLQATRFMTTSAPEVSKAFLRCAFNVVFNHKDDHAKNLALRMNEHMEWRLSPAFDSSFDPGPGGCHQTSVMGEARHPAREHLLALARACDVPKATAARCIDVVCEAAQRLEGMLDDAGVRKATRSRVVSATRENTARCARQP
jgi:serine/threonine-protein kinase HipA